MCARRDSERKDDDKIREVLLKELREWGRHNLEGVLSCYAPDPIHINADKSTDPRRWWVMYTTTEEWRDHLKRVFERREQARQRRRKDETAIQTQHVTVEIQHIDIKGEHALGVKLISSPGHIVLEFRTLKKIDGEWKITGGIHEYPGPIFYMI